MRSLITRMSLDALLARTMSAMQLTEVPIARDWRGDFGTSRRTILHRRLAGGYSPEQVRAMNGRNGVGNPRHRKHPGAK